MVSKLAWSLMRFFTQHGTMTYVNPIAYTYQARAKVGRVYCPPSVATECYKEMKNVSAVGAPVVNFVSTVD